ncbi:T9SS type A sorting domain-containing protein [uncultured Tenacibaculum sp.]|uniref:T9SS type A sorting domain-containing protein n=1 Tax=uncultured Tenacibaculum sp. TaxID=174713 RepID=UPI002611B548|nr:T9SS type A sorting domain-containing protein [uncultured Tenacibaculum sp.]
MKQKNFLFFLTLLFSLNIIGQTTLSPGDIIIIDVQADTPDRFKFVTLVDLEQNTEIHFTDAGWSSNTSSFATNEGGVTYTAPSLITRGTIIEYTDGDTSPFSEFIINSSSPGLGLSSAGDQILAFQGSIATPTFIFAVQTNSTAWQVGDFLGDTNQSNLPNGLTNDVNAVAAGIGPGAEDEYDNVYYNGSLTGTGKQISEAVGNSANWAGVNSAAPGGYTSPNITLTNVTWTGNSNNNWNEAGNWDSDIPEKYDNVIIPSTATNFPTVTSTPNDVYNITINSGGSLIALATINDNITYTRSLGTTNWYLVSSPVNGEDMADMRTNNNFNTNASNEISFAPYDNSQATPNDRWAYFANTATDALVNGKGYSTSLSTAGNISFTGTANSGDISIALTQGGGSGNNFNLLGNPYTAFVNSATFLTNESADLASQTIWVWNQNTSSYETKVTVDAFKVAPGQGFFVEANSTNNVTFLGNATMQSHETSDTFQRNARTEIQLFANDGTNNRFAKIYYINGTTTGFDNGYDGELFRGVSNSFDIYTQLLSENEGKNFQVQSLPNTNLETMIIPLGLTADVDKEITFSIASSNLPTGVEVYLEDRVNNTFVNLSEGDHTIKTKSASNGIGQYYIHTTAARLSNDDISKDIKNVSIYRSANNEITVTGLQAEANVKVFSLLGEELINTDINSNGVSKISLPNLSTGVYVIKLNSTLGNITKKVILE